MQHLAYQLDFTLEGQRTVATPNTAQDDTDLCLVCGHELFGPDAEACSWQPWGTFWEILGLSNVELVCGACGVSGNTPQEDEDIALAGAAAFETAMKSPAPPVTYLPAKQVDQAFLKGMPLARGANYKIDASHRDEPGIVEVHTRDTDIIYMLEGTATLITGGTVIDGKTIEPEEIRGRESKGGESRTVGKGDVLVIPNGTPHWFKEVNGPINYYVVKVRTAN